jgi:hypothetical protein
MPRKFKFCFQCRRTITEPEVQRGLFVQTPHGMLCATCAQQLDEETEAAKQLAAAQAPTPAAPPELPVEEDPAAVSPAEPPKEESAPEPAPIPQASVREREPAIAPAPVAPDPPAVQVQPPTPPESTPFGAPQPGGPEAPAEILDSMRQHLEAIHRTLVFEKSSLWNVLATVAQCLAVGMLILGAVNWADNPAHLLLVALIFQVMALTFFVRGK